jgi:hypothetical protein
MMVIKSIELYKPEAHGSVSILLTIFVRTDGQTIDAKL